MADSKLKLSRITVALHWIVGITIICMLAVGIYMEENEVYALYPIHKSVGALIFLVILARVVWRISQGWPEPVSTYSKIEQLLSKAAHYVLLIGSVIIPLSGLMMSIAGGHGLSIFGLEVVPTNPDPLNPDKTAPLNGSIAKAGHTLHGLVSNLMIATIVLHIAGALKHHIMDKDGTLKRMLGKSAATE